MHDKEFELEISGGGLRTFFMVAESDSDRDAWIQVFKDVGMKVMEAGEVPSTGVYHAGWLYKMGEFHRNWRRRYFVLDGAAVSYHESVDDAQVGRRNGSYSLKDYDTLSLVAEEEHQKAFEFCVSGPGRRTYYMAATSETDLLDWIEAFLKVARLKTTPDVQAFINRAGYKVVGPNETGGYNVVAVAETPAELVPIPDTAPVAYLVKVINGHQSFHFNVTTESVSFVSRSNVKTFTYQSIYSYDFKMVDGTPVITLHPRVPGTRKCKVYKIVPENEAILHHIKARFEAMIQMVIEAKKLFVTVKSTYEPVSEKDVAVETGEEVTIVKEVKGGMLLIRKKDGTAGTVPATSIDIPKAVRLNKNKKKGRRASRIPVAAANGIDELVEGSAAPSAAQTAQADKGQSEVGETDAAASGAGAGASAAAGASSSAAASAAAAASGPIDSSSGSSSSSNLDSSSSGTYSSSSGSSSDSGDDSSSSS